MVSRVVLEAERNDGGVHQVSCHNGEIIIKTGQRLHLINLAVTKELLLPIFIRISGFSLNSTSFSLSRPVLLK